MKNRDFRTKFEKTVNKLFLCKINPLSTDMTHLVFIILKQFKITFLNNDNEKFRPYFTNYKGKMPNLLFHI